MYEFWHFNRLCIYVYVFKWFSYGNGFLQMWPELIQKSKEGGLDAIETYVFWNLHEPVKGQVYFFALSNCILGYLQSHIGLVFICLFRIIN